MIPEDSGLLATARSPVGPLLSLLAMVLTTIKALLVDFRRDVREMA